MAFNAQTFKTRALSAVIFAVVMLVGLLWNHWSFFILFSVIHFGCWIEYQKLLGQIDKNYAAINPFHKYGIMVAGWCIMLFFTNELYTIFGFNFNELGYLGAFIIIISVPIMELLVEKQVKLKQFGYSILGLIYISLAWGLMINLRNPVYTDATFGKRDNGWIIPVVIISSIWINDTMAYIVGSFIGRTPFSKISPKKTWEGTLGGAILCVVIITSCFQSLLYWKHLLAISAIAAVAGTLGDLLESKLKRMANVKDSGHIMPGHGGFLDRFDSLLIATPCVWLYVTFMIK